MPPLDDPEPEFHPEPDRDGLCLERLMEEPRDGAEDEVPILPPRP